MTDRSFLKNIILVDLENTLSDSGHRMKWLKTNNKKFNEEFKNDAPDLNIINFTNSFYSSNYNIKIVVLSAKREEYRQMAESWLKNNNVIYDELVMQRDKDKRTPPEYKSDFVKENRNRILFAMDDVGKTCAMIAENYIPVLHVKHAWQYKEK